MPACKAAISAALQVTSARSPPSWLGGAAFSAILGLISPGPAEAWDRGDVHNFATIPTFAPGGPAAPCPNEATSCTSDVEGVAVALDGTVYSASYGYKRGRRTRRVWRIVRFRAERRALNPFAGRRLEPASNRVGVPEIVQERADRRSRQG